MNAAKKVVELSAKRDELKKNHARPSRELTDQIVKLKNDLKRLPESAKAERAKLGAEIIRLEAEREKLGRAPGLDAVMLDLREAREAAAEEASAALYAELEKLTDEDLESRHHAVMARRAALKAEVVAISRTRSSRAKVATNKALLKDLTAEEILASLSPEQRAALTKSA